MIFLTDYQTSTLFLSPRKSLGKIPGISEADIKKVLDDVHGDDQFLEAQSKLDTEYKMKQFLKERFIHVSLINSL